MEQLGKDISSFRRTLLIRLRLWCLITKTMTRYDWEASRIRYNDMVHEDTVLVEQK
jgi:hypothetical protein